MAARLSPKVLAALVSLVLVAGAIVAAARGGQTSPASGTRAVGAPRVPSAAPAVSPRATPTAAPVALRWTPCGAPVECASLLVPVDWSGADASLAGAQFAIALDRVRATGNRIGSLVINPGGPGESGVDYLRSAYTAIPAEVRARFDLVGFDPRGTGASGGIHCLSGPQLDAAIHLDPAPSGQPGVDALVTAAQTEARSCAAHYGSRLSHVATVDVARDLEALRVGLGDVGLTYLGYSYGTAIGAAYAEMFGNHIRAMVLDGALDPALDAVALLGEQADGFDAAFRSWAAWCASTAACAFRASAGGASATASSVGQAYDRLVSAVRTRPLPGAAGRRVGPGEFINGVLYTLYSSAVGWPELGRALTDAAAGSGGLMLALADTYVQRSPTGVFSSLEEANLAVNCTDRPWPQDPAVYERLAASLGATDPRFGPAIAYSGLGCAPWAALVAGPRSTPHAVRAPQAPPIVVVGTTGDPATPYPLAVALAHELASGLLVTHVGDGHTVYRVGAPTCLLAPLDAYVITAAAPGPGLRC